VRSNILPVRNEVNTIDNDKRKTKQVKVTKKARYYYAPTKSMDKIKE
jgi:hypothetical protein